MTALVVTDEMVLRWPFAVNAARITSEMEADIGRRMAAQAKAEGHVRLLPASKPRTKEDELLARAMLEADVFRVLMSEDCAPKSVNQVRSALRRDRPVIEEVLGRMVRDGRVVIAGVSNRGNGRGHAPLYAVRGSNSPGSGECGPAQPGNPQAGLVRSGLDSKCGAVGGLTAAHGFAGEEQGEDE